MVNKKFRNPDGGDIHPFPPSGYAPGCMVLIKTKERNNKQCTITITKDNSVAVIRLYTPNPVSNLTHQPDALYNLTQFRNEKASFKVRRSNFYDLSVSLGVIDVSGKFQLFILKTVRMHVEFTFFEWLTLYFWPLEGTVESSTPPRPVPSSIWRFCEVWIL